MAAPGRARRVQHPPGRYSEGGVGLGIVVKGNLDDWTSVRGAGVKAVARGAGAERSEAALTPGSTRGRCRPDDARSPFERTIAAAVR